VVLTGLALFVAGCGVLSPEEQLLADFFSAARLHDTSMLGNIASVDFNPRSDGIVQDFEILRSESSSEGGGTETSRVRVDAHVRMMDGRIEARTLLITIQREREGRWRVNGLQRQTDQATR